MDYPTLFSEIQESPAQASKRASALYEVCQRLVDGRRARGKRYDLAGLVVVLVLAKLAGMQSLLGASQWIQDQQAFLCARLRLSWKRTPCANTYSYALALRDEPTGKCSFGSLVRAPGGSKPLWRRTEPFSDTAKRSPCPSGN